MAKTIDTLIDDIFDLLVNGKEISEADASAFGNRMAELVKDRLAPREPRGGTLRMSNIGKPCTRQLWYEVNTPDDSEELHMHTYSKFLVGDILEEFMLFLAEQSGHKVEGQQDELEFMGILGHRDCIIDGVPIDCKTASPYSFKKFEGGLKPEDDGFGYLTQIQSYMKASEDDDRVTDKTKGGFLVFHKVTGEIALDLHAKSDIPLDKIYEYKIEATKAEEPPERCFEPEPMGKSGNMKLGFQCAYCPFKHKCYPELRTFIYSTGPVYLTDVQNEPKVPEVDRDGNEINHST